MIGERAMSEHLLKYLKEDHVLTPMVATKKADAIREVASLLDTGIEIPSFRPFLSALFQKESRYGSAVEHGVALPHYRDSTVMAPVVGLGISKVGIDWGDEKVVRILVLIAWPDRNDQAYLNLVADIARMLQHKIVRNSLLDAATPSAIMKIFRGQDDREVW